MGCAQVAQLVEQRTENPCVDGSSPSLGTIVVARHRAFSKTLKKCWGPQEKNFISLHYIVLSISCRRIRVANSRIVYKVYSQKIEILIIAIGARRDNIIYKMSVARAS
jgi:mRNA-degrading endonuclease RelE of RelBE toxin-antitoxin system